MVPLDRQLSASEVLRTFHRDKPSLFLGAAFSTVGIVTAAFCLLRRRFDAPLVWLGVFAFLYGQRIWLNTGLLHITLAGNDLFARLRWAVDFIVPIPAFLFFEAADLLVRRGKLVTAILSLLFLSLAVAVFVVGRQPLLHEINNVLVIAALPWVLVRTFLMGKHDHDFVVLRSGLSVFVALALWDNLGGAERLGFDLEPFGFVVLLACLGYVAGRRTLERDQQLSEIQKELDVARSIQMSILPGEFPASTSFRVAAKYVPMAAVAGDLYDYLRTDKRSAGLLNADVSGHGVPAALIASMVKMAATAQRGQAEHPARLLAGMNAALCGNTQGQFVTAAYVHLSAQARELRYAAAGHPAMLLLRGGEVTEVAENGLLLAATDEAQSTERSMVLEPGDRLLLYTDGLPEQKNAQGEMFGDELLAAELQQAAKLTPAEAVERIIAKVQSWGISQEDDLTALVCDLWGSDEMHV